jgi:hypothetical protein
MTFFGLLVMQHVTSQAAHVTGTYLTLAQYNTTFYEVAESQKRDLSGPMRICILYSSMVM